MLGNQDHASWSGNSLLLLFHAPVLTFEANFFTDFEVFSFIFMSLWVVWKRFESDRLRNLRITCFLRGNFRCCCCFTLQFQHFVLTDFELSFLLDLYITLNCLETFWVRQIKKLEENNHRFASALASASIFLTRLLSLLFVYSGNWNYSLYTWRQIRSQEAQATGCHI